VSFASRLFTVGAVLAVLLVLLVLGIAFSPERVQARAAGQPLLPGAFPQKVVGIDILTGGVLTISMRRTGSGWEISSGLNAYPASSPRITTFLRIVAGLFRTSLVARDSTHDGELGLAPNSVRQFVLHHAQGPDLAVDVGTRAPGGDADYVRVRGEQSVYLARGSVSFFLGLKASSWYELHILPDDVKDTTIAFVRTEGGIDLDEAAGGPLIGGYTLRRPSADKLDQWVIEESSKPVDRILAAAMVNSLANLDGMDFADSSAAAARAGGEFLVTVETFAGNKYVLDVRRALEPGKLLLRSDWSRWAWIVNPLAMQRAVLPEARLLAQ
jgi:hypothetical protein